MFSLFLPPLSLWKFCCALLRFMMPISFSSITFYSHRISFFLFLFFRFIFWVCMCAHMVNLGVQTHVPMSSRSRLGKKSLSLIQELAWRPASHSPSPVSAPKVLGYRWFLCGCWIFKFRSSSWWNKHSTPEPSLQSCIPCSYGPLSVLKETRYKQILPGSWDCDHAHCCLF